MLSLRAHTPGAGAGRSCETHANKADAPWPPAPGHTLLSMSGPPRTAANDRGIGVRGGAAWPGQRGATSHRRPQRARLRRGVSYVDRRGVHDERTEAIADHGACRVVAVGGRPRSVGRRHARNGLIEGEGVPAHAGQRGVCSNPRYPRVSQHTPLAARREPSRETRPRCVAEFLRGSRALHHTCGAGAQGVCDLSERMLRQCSTPPRRPLGGVAKRA
jgi:hypothetical protein